MSTDIKTHRLGAYIYGFLSGVGFIMIIWGLASTVMLPALNLLMNIGLTLFGVALFACGSCREAFLRGNLSAPPITHTYTKPNRPKTTKLVSEQLIGTPEEIEAQKAQVS